MGEDVPRDSEFGLPDRLTNEHGAIRMLGFELEFAGLELDDIARVVMGLFGGVHYADSHFQHRVADTRWGDFVIEIDAALLKDRAYIGYLQRIGFDLDQGWQRRLDEVLARIAGTVVPHEIATPPIPMTEAGCIEELRAALRSRHAQGTRASPLYAFGMHFNPEAPALHVETLTAYLRAYLILEDWLKQRSQVAITRQIVPFINDFPEDYVRHVVDPDYRPSLRRLMADYLYHNPTRNRPLDMLPLFGHLDPDWLFARLPEDTLVRTRPTFHYRLPNCAVDEPGWRVAREWHGWLEVEQLANDPASLGALGRRFLKWHRETLSGTDERWADEIRRWQVETGR